MQRSWYPPRALWNVLLMGATLRLVGLNVHSLWLDEGATWSWASRPTWGGTVFAEANHPPAWWVVTRLWIGAFGDSEASLRMPAAVLGILLLPLAWLVGLRLLDPASMPRRGGFDPVRGGGGRAAAAWFTGLVAGSAYFVEYAQEARMYSALLVETLGLSLLYLRWLDRDDRASLVGYAVLGAVALHTHYFAVWPLAAHAAHAIWAARRSRGTPEAVRPWPFLGAVVAAGLLFVPWFVHLATHYERIATGRPYEPFGRLLYVLWRMGAGPGLVVVDRVRQTEGEAAVIQEEAGFVVLAAVLWLVPVAYGLAGLRRVPGTASFVLASLLVPVVLLLAVFPWFPLVHERYLVFLAPWVFLLAALGAFRAGAGLRPVLLGGLVVLLGTGLVAYFASSTRLAGVGTRTEVAGRRVPTAFVPDPEDPLRVLHHGHPYGKEPWREAHEMVATLAGEGDVVLLAPHYLHLVWDYYGRRRIERISLPATPPTPAEIRTSLGADLRDRKRVFLVLAHEETEDPDAWFHALRGALAGEWTDAGAATIVALPPVAFLRSWGVRVAVFERP